MGSTIIRIIAGVFALVVLALIVRRRRRRAAE